MPLVRNKIVIFMAVLALAAQASTASASVGSWWFSQLTPIKYISEDTNAAKNTKLDDGSDACYEGQTIHQKYTVVNDYYYLKVKYDSDFGVLVQPRDAEPMADWVPESYNEDDLPAAGKAVIMCKQAALDEGKIHLAKDDPINAMRDSLTGAKWYIVDKVIQLIMVMVSLAALLGNTILYYSSRAMGPLLTQGSFITNPIVTRGWPFVQGLANIGFIIALLFIALATTLRLESYGARRILPRLLIAALLLNFSLVLTGLLIDISRLLMAIMANSMGGSGSVEKLGADILKNSDAFRSVFKEIGGEGSITTNNAAASFPLKVIEATILIWGLAIGFAVIAVGLFIRYVALLFLLILSPLAFLAVAIPGANKFAMQWWNQFVKYLIYGPAALFILLILVGLGNKEISTNIPLIDGLAHIAMTIALLVAAGTIGKKIGMVGAAATTAFVSKRGKQLARAPLNYPKTTAAVVAVGGAPLAAAGIGAAYLAGRGAKRQVGDFTSKVSGGIAAKARSGGILGGVGKFVAGAERDDKGNLKAGQKSTGSIAAGWVNKKFGFRDVKQAEQSKNARTAAQAAILDPTSKNVASSTALTPTMLGQKHIAEDLSVGELAGILTHAEATQGQKKAILNNPEAVKKLMEDDKTSGTINQILNADVKIDAPTNLSTNVSLHGKNQALANEAANISNASKNAKGRENAELVRVLQQSINKNNEPKK